jgi:hypothetical protein
MTDPRPADELLQRYDEASAEDTRRPASQVREAVRAHVLSVTESRAETKQVTHAPAANQSRWKISLLASIALAGLTGLLVLQFDRGTPDEQEVAYGTPAPAASPPAAAPVPPPPASPAPAATSEKAVRSTAPTPAQKAAPRTPPPSRESRADAGLVRDERAMAPSPVPAAPAAQTGNAAMAEASSAPPAPAAARAVPPPVAVARAPALMQKNEGMAAPAVRANEDAVGASAGGLSAALHEAARTGRLAEMERLLQQGAPINAADNAGRTALMLAVIHGHTAVVQRLLALGANKALVDREGLSALDHARRLGLDPMVNLMATGR